MLTNGMLEEGAGGLSADAIAKRFDSLGAQSIEDAAYAYYKEWGIGQKGKDNGLLFLIALNDMKYRIRTELKKLLQDILILPTSLNRLYKISIARNLLL